MIAWLNPAAFLGLIVLAGPISIHLLRRQRAERVPFPSLRFVRPSRTAAVRFRLPADLSLLAVRVLILLVAVAALAQPVVLPRSRTDAWNSRTARATVVDTSDSMKRTDDGPAPAVQADALAGADAADAVASTRIDARRLRTGLEQAVAWLSTTAPARRELVVISDFQKGALTPADMAVVPASIGVRLRQTDATVRERRLEGPVLFGTTQSQSQALVLSRGATAVSMTPRDPAADGLQIVTPDSGRAAADTLVQVVASAGAPAPAREQPLVVTFAGATPRGAQPITSPWMLQAVLRLRADTEIGAATMAEPISRPVADDPPWSMVVRDAGGRPVVRAAAAGPALMIDVAAQPSSYLAAAVVRGALIARYGPVARPEEEVQRLTPTELARWERPAAPVGGDAWRGSDVSDARWCWAIALVLLCAETWLRRARGAAQAAGAQSVSRGADADAA